jgi:hypothetical protein
MSQQEPGAEVAARDRRSPTPMGTPGPEPPAVAAMPPVLYITPKMPPPETVPSVEAEQVRIDEDYLPPLEELLSQGIERSEPEEQ